MDSRLFTIDGHRPMKLRRQDLPLVVSGVIAVMRRNAILTSGRCQGIDYVSIALPDLTKVVILKEDWGKVMPYILDGTLDPTLTATSQQVGYAHPQVSYSEPVLDRADAPLYKYLLNLFTRLFPDTWPTSNT